MKPFVQIESRELKRALVALVGHIADCRDSA